MISENLFNTKAENDSNIEMMMKTIHMEIKDLKSSNHVYAIELERNQSLFREMQKECVDNLTERKEQNLALLDESKQLAIKDRRRRSTVNKPTGDKPGGG